MGAAQVHSHVIGGINATKVTCQGQLSLTHVILTSNNVAHREQVFVSEVEGGDGALPDQLGVENLRHEDVRFPSHFRSDPDFRRTFPDQPDLFPESVGRNDFLSDVGHRSKFLNVETEVVQLEKFTGNREAGKVRSQMLQKTKTGTIHYLANGKNAHR